MASELDDLCTITTMAKALNGVHNIDSATECIRAYRAAGVQEKDYKRLHFRAHRIAEIERETPVKKSTVLREIAEGAGSILALGSVVATILLMTPSAGHAAEVVGEAPTTIIGTLALFISCAIIVSAVIAAFVHWLFPLPASTDPYEDENDYGEQYTPSNWRR